MRRLSGRLVGERFNRVTALQRRTAQCLVAQDMTRATIHGRWLTAVAWRLWRAIATSLEAGTASIGMGAKPNVWYAIEPGDGANNPPAPRRPIVIRLAFR